MKADETEKNIQDAPAGEINENDLESVSGGRGLSFLTRCKCKFDPAACFDGGRELCTALYVDRERSSDDKGEMQHEYLITCSGGYFIRLRDAYHGINGSGFY